MGAQQRSQSPDGKLGKGRHAEKCSKRFEQPLGRASGRHSPVPNFKHLHTTWENKLADCKASNRFKSTRPQVKAENYMGKARLALCRCDSVSMPFTNRCCDSVLTVLSIHRHRLQPLVACSQGISTSWSISVLYIHTHIFCSASGTRSRRRLSRQQRHQTSERNAAT